MSQEEVESLDIRWTSLGRAVAVVLLLVFLTTSDTVDGFVLRLPLLILALVVLVVTLFQVYSSWNHKESSHDG